MNSGVPAGIFTGVQVGAALVASQAAVSDTGPGALGVLRYALALVMLLPLLFSERFRPSRIAPNDLPMLMLLGTGQIGVMIALLNTALVYTSSARVALVLACLPLFTLIFDSAVRGRSPDPAAQAGAALCVAGIAVLIGGDALSGRITGDDILGLAAAAAGTLSLAVCSTFYRPYVQRYGALMTSVIAFAVSLAPLAVLTWLLPPNVAPGSWPAATWWLVVGVGVSSGLGFLTWFHAIARLPAPTVTGFLSLSPPVAAFLSAVFLDSHLTLSIWVSTAIVCAGLLCFACSRPAGRTPAGH